MTPPRDFVCLALLLFAPVLAAQEKSEPAWQSRLSELASMKDPKAALDGVAELEKELAAEKTNLARRRLGELIVRVKLPRQTGFAQGATAMKALSLFEEVLKTEPDDVPTLYLHATSCASMPSFFKKGPAAKASLERLVALEKAAPGSVPHADVFSMLAKIELKEFEDVLAAGLRAFPDDARLKKLQERRTEPLPSEQPKVDPESARASKTRFKEALLEGRYEYGPLDREMAAGQALDPEDHEYPLFRALLRLWALEGNSNPRLAVEAEKLFERALELNPADTRIYGWLGPLVFVTGRTTGDEKKTERGIELLDKGVDLNPEQNLFSRALAYRVTGLKPVQVQADLYGTLDLACGTKVDRSRFLGGEIVSDHPSMGDSEKAPYNLSGTLYWAGEFFRSQEDSVRARDAFEGALRLDGARSWPFRKLAEERLARFDNPTLELTKNPVSCLLCHQR